MNLYCEHLKWNGRSTFLSTIPNHTITSCALHGHASCFSLEKWTKVTRSNPILSITNCQLLRSLLQYMCRQATILTFFSNRQYISFESPKANITSQYIRVNQNYQNLRHELLHKILKANRLYDAYYRSRPALAASIGSIVNLVGEYTTGNPTQTIGKKHICNLQ